MPPASRNSGGPIPPPKCVSPAPRRSELRLEGPQDRIRCRRPDRSDYYLHDTVVPRAQLADILEQIYEITDRHEVTVMNVFHAGDGNLHPLLVFDAREEGTLERVHAAGAEILRASLAAGGVLSGEHGIGVEKKSYMADLFSPADLYHQNRLRQAFDPACRANPGKVLPMGHSCADIQALREMPTGVWG